MDDAFSRHFDCFPIARVSPGRSGPSLSVDAFVANCRASPIIYMLPVAELDYSPSSEWEARRRSMLSLLIVSANTRLRLRSNLTTAIQSHPRITI